MNLKIVTVADRGAPNKERIHLAVLANANLVNYALFDTDAAGPTTIVSIPKRAYWFQSFTVVAGDNVILYTGAGRQLSNLRTDGRRNHFFYWGLPTVIWDSPTSRVVLVEISTWETSAPLT
jgi:hypothetical protein